MRWLELLMAWIHRCGWSICSAASAFCSSNTRMSSTISTPRLMNSSGKTKVGATDEMVCWEWRGGGHLILLVMKPKYLREVGQYHSCWCPVLWEKLFNTTAADDLFPCIARSSASLVLTMGPLWFILFLVNYLCSPNAVKQQKMLVYRLGN